MRKIFKKWGMLIVILFFVGVIGLLGLFSWMSVNKYKEVVAQRDSIIGELEGTLESIGPLVKGHVVVKDVRVGQKIEEEDLQEVDIPEKVANKTALNKEDIVGKYYRLSLTEGTVLTSEDIVEDVIDNTVREYDLIIDELPIGLSVGDYVDIRISFPFGEDFVAMSGKKILAINSGVPKIYVSEYDLITYNSMLVDKALYTGAKIYAIRYKDAGSQANAEVFYPVNKNMGELININPNILEDVKQSMVLSRVQLDNMIGGAIDERTDIELERINQSIERSREISNRTMAIAQNELERRLELEKLEAQKEQY